MSDLVEGLRRLAEVYPHLPLKEAAGEIEQLIELLVEAKNERDIWRERALSK